MTKHKVKRPKGWEQASHSATRAAECVAAVCWSSMQRALQEPMADRRCLREEEHSVLSLSSLVPQPRMLTPAVRGERRHKQSNMQSHLDQVISASVKQESIYHK